MVSPPAKISEKIFFIAFSFIIELIRLIGLIRLVGYSVTFTVVVTGSLHSEWSHA